MTRKKSAGLFLTVLTVLAALVGVIEYVVNTGTNYFKNLGTNPVIMGCLIAAILFEVVYLAAGLKNQPAWADILPIVSCVLFVVALLTFVSARANGIAAIMTFENNANNMADLSSAIVGIGACAAAIVFAIIASFFDVTVEA